MTESVFYPTTEEILALHAAIIGVAESEVPALVRDLNLLESALARPQNEAAYESAGLSRQAGTLLWGIAKNHPFRDGNKRTAFVVMQAFLRANGLTTVAGEDDTYDLVIAVAQGDLDVDAVERWIDQHLFVWLKD